MKKALITGITGQDGSLISEILIEKDYQVHGIIRRCSSFNTQRIDHLYEDPQHRKHLFLHYGDLTDSSNISKLINEIEPDEIYHLGAQSHVGVSFKCPEYTVSVIMIGTMSLLESIKNFFELTGKKIKFYNASSSEQFGDVLEIPQRETTPFNPRSPYACAKVFGYYQTKNYREAYNLFCSSGILFNHESSKRGENFVSRKITRAVTRIKMGLQEKLYLGNLDAKRDWGYAKDYVEAMYLILQHTTPDDFVIATGETHSVKEFVDRAFDYYKLDWKKYVEIDPRYFRPSEVNLLQGDYSKAKNLLGWEPKVRFNELIKIMCDSDMELAKKERKLLE